MPYLRFALVGLVALATVVTTALAVAWPKDTTDHDVLSLRAAADLPVSALGRGHSHQGQSHEGDLHATVGASAAGSPWCDKDVDVAGSLAGLTFVAAQDNGICSSADIDVYEQDDGFYVVQAGGRDAAFTITHIAADGTPTLITQKTWQQTNTWTPDVKAFKQGDRRYIALSLQSLSSINSTCGSVIVDVTNAPDTTVVEQVTGSDWCNVHNSFVESDANGDGRYLYITANATNDMRVLYIGDLSNISEIGRYTHPDAGSGFYVHDVTVVDHGASIGRRVYVSYWNAGLMVLDAADVTPGVVEAGSPNQPLNPDYSIRPAGFRTHHAYPSEDGTHVFIQDEFFQNPGDEPVEMWDISSPATPTYVDGIALGSPLMPVVTPAHNLLVDGDRLYVGWYRAGLQAFDFNATGFVDRPIYHQVQTEADDDTYEGAWSVRVTTIGPTTYVFQSDRRYGLIVDNLSPPIDSDEDGVADAGDRCPGTIASPVDGNGCSDAQVDADGDGVCDLAAPSDGPAGCIGSDNCPATVNPDQEDRHPNGIGDHCDDPDGDGFTDHIEAHVGTDPDDPCAATLGQNDEGPPDVWPVDFNDDQKAGMQDIIFAFVTTLAPDGLNQPATGPLVRVDLNGDGFINMVDVIFGYVFKLAPTGLNTMCTP
jgi:hypothetical protein